MSFLTKILDIATWMGPLLSPIGAVLRRYVPVFIDLILTAIKITPDETFDKEAPLTSPHVEVTGNSPTDMVIMAAPSVTLDKTGISKVTPDETFDEELDELIHNHYIQFLIDCAVADDGGSRTLESNPGDTLKGWTYRKKFTITGSSDGALTNFPMMMTVNRSSGTDSGWTVYLDTKCNVDISDLCFTEDDGITIIPHAVLEISGTVAKVWINFPSIPASPSTVDYYIYYGHSWLDYTLGQVTSVFDEWWNFLESISGLNLGYGWEIGGKTGLYTDAIHGSDPLLDWTDGAITDPGVSAEYEYFIEFSASQILICAVGRDGTWNYLTDKYVGAYIDKAYAQVYLFSHNGVSPSGATSMSFNTGQRYKITIRRTSTSNWYLYVDDVLKVTETSWTDTSFTVNYIGMKQNASGNIYWGEYLIARKSTANLPTITTWASEYNYSDPAGDPTANDMTLLPASPQIGDAYEFGGYFKFSKLILNIGTAGAGSWAITWKYWNGSTWATCVSVFDGTNDFTTSGLCEVTHTPQGDWATKTQDGYTVYRLRAEVTSYSSITTQPKGTQCWYEREA